MIYITKTTTTKLSEERTKTTMETDNTSVKYKIKHIIQLVKINLHKNEIFVTYRS